MLMKPATSTLAVVLSVMCFLLTACGGNPEPVTGIQTPNLRYTGSLAAVTVELTGNVLDNSIKVYANNTACFVAAATGALTRSATCLITVPDSLKLPVRVTSASDYTLYSTTLDVPVPQVTFKTSLGDFVMELNPTAAPKTVANFLSYVHKSPSFYNGTIFHRVISGFVAQAGGFTPGMSLKSGLSAAIQLESNNGLTNDRGTVAMARSSDANSATSQFYVNLVNNTSLNYASNASPGYAVFGRVISGMDVIDLIATKPTTTVNGYANVPVTDITITSATQTQ